MVIFLIVYIEAPHKIHVFSVIITNTTTKTILPYAPNLSTKYRLFMKFSRTNRHAAGTCALSIKRTKIFPVFSVLFLLTNANISAILSIETNRYILIDSKLPEGKGDYL